MVVLMCNSVMLETVSSSQSFSFGDWPFIYLFVFLGFQVPACATLTKKKTYPPPQKKCNNFGIGPHTAIDSVSPVFRNTIFHSLWEVELWIVRKISSQSIILYAICYVLSFFVFNCSIVLVLYQYINISVTWNTFGFLDLSIKYLENAINMFLVFSIKSWL